MSIIPIILKKKRMLQGSNVNYKEDTFAIPTEGFFDIPMDSISNWTMKRTTGTPTPSLSVIDVPEDDNQKKIRGNKAIRFITGGTGTFTNEASYTLQGGNKPDDITGYNFLVWLKLEDGIDVYEWIKATGIYFMLYKDWSNYFRYLLGAVNVQYASSGWYAFSITPSTYSLKTGSLTLGDVTSVGIQIAKQTTDSPIVQIGMISIVPKKAKAQILWMCDGGYSSHLNIANVLKAHNMYGSFYVDNGSALSISELLEMQSNGHLIGAYARNWGANISPLSNAINILTTAQAWLNSNGLNGGKYFIHGISSAMTEEAWNTVFYRYANSCGYGNATVSSPYHKNFSSRYHEFKAANIATLTTLVNNAIVDGAKLGILAHDLTGEDYTSFVDFIENTLYPLQVSGDIEVITAKQAFESV